MIMITNKIKTNIKDLSPIKLNSDHKPFFIKGKSMHAT